MSSTTDTEAGTGKKFHLKENRKGTTKLESRDILCISMEGGLRRMLTDYSIC